AGRATHHTPDCCNAGTGHHRTGRSGPAARRLRAAPTEGVEPLTRSAIRTFGMKCAGARFRSRRRCASIPSESRRELGRSGGRRWSLRLVVFRLPGAATCRPRVSCSTPPFLLKRQGAGPDGPLTVQIARSLTEFDHETAELLWAFLLAGPLTVGATL